ncbi:MAG: hypothetical protein IJ916_10980 [Paludibacteraceae bacterium]|nr:hypothetical protein [Paludibacteraceae bacterium]
MFFMRNPLSVPCSPMLLTTAKPSQHACKTVQKMAFKTKQKTGDDIRLYHTDHLGSTALVTDIDGEVTQHVAYIPYGEIFVEQRNGSWASPYLFNAKELDEETGLYYYGARYLDPTGTRWLSVDPLFEKYVGMTPYGYCAGNPVKLVDVDGRKPIYDEDGNFLGTDENGLQGDPIVMWKDNFVQGMSEKEAQQNDLGLEFLSLQTGYTGDDGKDPYERFMENYTKLSSRPDWDGVVTDLEARAWWNNRSGADLYIDVSKIDLSPLTKSDFKEEEGNILQFNFFLSPGSSKTTARVHGTLTMRLKNRETGEVGFFRDKNGYIDTYDFNSDGRIVRDITTWGARQVVGEGKGYGFRPYGKNPTLKK